MIQKDLIRISEYEYKSEVIPPRYACGTSVCHPAAVEAIMNDNR
jgi:hypothetical protein